VTWVKVCGLTRPVDVETAVAAGADAVGFVSHPGSPRYVSLPLIADLATGVPVMRVILTVDLGVRAALTAVEATGVDAIQPYGSNAADVAAAAVESGVTVLRPFPARAGLELPEDDGSIPLLDSPDDEAFGGTGRTFDWSWVQDLGRRFVLAGGLNPSNVAAAVRLVRPWGVDASSGLEASPGIKHPGKVSAFVQEAKRA
jgi:phosphoribosylanthranilate isomerase